MSARDLEVLRGPGSLANVKDHACILLRIIDYMLYVVKREDYIGRNAPDRAMIDRREQLCIRFCRICRGPKRNGFSYASNSTLRAPITSSDLHSYIPHIYPPHTSIPIIQHTYQQVHTLTIPYTISTRHQATKPICFLFISDTQSEQSPCTLSQYSLLQPQNRISTTPPFLHIETHLRITLVISYVYTCSLKLGDHR